MKIFALLVLGTWLAVSTLASIQPEWFDFVRHVPGRDKLLHFLGAGILSSSMITGFPSVVVRKRRFGPLLVLAVTALLITLEELGQLAVPSRIFDRDDLWWSYLGLAVFGLIALGVRRLRNQAL